MTVAQIVAALGLIGTVSGATIAIESRYAHDEDVQKVAYRLDQKIKQDRCDWLQRQLWALQDRFGPNCGARADQCRQIRAEMAKLGCPR